MGKIILNIICVFSTIFLGWIAISWVEIFLKNLDGITVSSWNFFQVLPKLF